MKLIKAHSSLLQRTANRFGHELRWLAPVRPGDQLSLRINVTEARRSRSKPDRGMVQTFNEFVNQRGEAVMTVKAMTLMRCRATTERD